METSASQSVVLRPTAAASPGDLLEMSVLGEHPRPPGDFDVHWSLGAIAFVCLQLLESSVGGGRGVERSRDLHDNLRQIGSISPICAGKGGPDHEPRAGAVDCRVQRANTENSQSGSLWEVYLVLLMIQSEASGRYPGKEGRLLMLSALVPNEGKSSLHCVYVFKN